MLRRIKSNDNKNNEGGNANTPPSSQNSETNEQMSSLQRYRSQTMKDYGLMIEYKHLKQHVPGGVYVLPSFDHPRIWYGTIFIHQGLYRNGIFKFTIHLPDNYNGPGTYPRIIFNTNIFHPYIHPETRELDLRPKFPEWDPELHYMVGVLTYLKSIFYMKDFPQISRNVVHPAALEVFRKDPEKYVINVENSVEASLEQVFSNDPNVSIRFTKPIPAHENLRRELFAQFENNSTEETTSTNNSSTSTITTTSSSTQNNKAIEAEPATQ